MLRRWLNALWADRPGRVRPPSVERQTKTHVVLLDGTLSSLEPGKRSSIGLIYELLNDEDCACIYYEPGIQWRGWRHVHEVMAGVGINRQIRRAYGFLAEKYRPGDRIYLMGYSRGAYAVRALAGLIDRVGLLRKEHSSEANIEMAYQAYRDDPTRPEVRSFAARLCHPRVTIDAIGVFDTVQAVGIRWPVLWRLFPHVHAFRSHRLGRSVAHGYHALALHENRAAFEPELWRTRGRRSASVEQVWFRGSHSDLGGQAGGDQQYRPLANVPLHWMLSRMEGAGMELPADWRRRFPKDVNGPSLGSWRGFGVFFLTRRRRRVGGDPSERLHPSAVPHAPKGLDVPTWGKGQASA